MSAHPSPELTRDIIVIGTSAGGVEALPRVLQQLPEDLGASVCIAQHMAPTERPHLVDILRRSARVKVDWAEQGAPLEHGHVYVAPPDTHLMFSDDHLRLSHGPRENFARPSIDKLFRSAAAVHGGRVIGVVLTGMLDDGVAGLKAIHEAGGAVVVQDPQDAAYPEMPSRALLAVPVDRTLPIDAIGGALIALCREVRGNGAIARAVALEAQSDEVGQVSPATLNELGTQTPISCPACNGPTWLVGDEHARTYLCYLGHSSSPHTLLEETALEVERALWSAVRALGDRAGTLETLAADANRTGCHQIAEGYATRAREAREQAELARQFLIDVISPR
ncbi:chemotaxis protein CheB [soil metagenome]